MALEMKTACEKCEGELTLDAEAYICSFECTFCAACAGEMNAIWDKLYPAFQAGALPDDAAGQEKLKQALANLEAHPAKSSVSM